MYLYQNSGVLASIMDSEGRCFRIPTKEAFEVKPQNCTDTDKGGVSFEKLIPAEKVAAQLCIDGVFYGVVILPEIRDTQGSRFDYETAERESTRVRLQAETNILERYVRHSKQEQLSARPIHPPTPALERILNSRGLDLQKDYGITPVGYKIGEGAMARDKRMAELEAENKSLHTEVADMKTMLSRLIELQEKKKQPA